MEVKQIENIINDEIESYKPISEKGESLKNQDSQTALNISSSESDNQNVIEIKRNIQLEDDKIDIISDKIENTKEQTEVEIKKEVSILIPEHKVSEHIRNEDPTDNNETKKQKKNETPFYLQPHNRFQYSESSRFITGSDPSSYHKLGIALTDSYIENGNLVRLKNKTLRKINF